MRQQWQGPVAHLAHGLTPEPGFQPLAEGCIISWFDGGCVCHHRSQLSRACASSEPALVSQPSQGQLEGSSWSRVSWSSSTPALESSI